MWCNTKRVSAVILLWCAFAPGISALKTDQLACLADPTAEACMGFTVDSNELDEALEMLCGGETVASSCSLARLCADGTASGSLCEPFSLLATACSELSSAPGAAALVGNDTMACELIDALCVEGSKVTQCRQSPAVPNLVTSEAAKAAMQEMCGTHFMPSCTQCGSEGAPCTNPLAALAKACTSMPGMYECQGFAAMCSQAAVAATFKSLCS